MSEIGAALSWGSSSPDFSVSQC